MTEKVIQHEGKAIGTARSERRAWNAPVWTFRSIDGRFSGVASSYEDASAELIRWYAERKEATA